MSNIKTTIFSVICILIFNFQVHMAHGSNMLMEDMVDQMVLEVGELHSYDFALASNTFRKIFDAPLPHIRAAMDYLGKDYPDKNKTVVILSMNKLPLPQHFSFAGFCFDLFERNELSESQLYDALFFSFTPMPTMIREYKNKDVILLLENILKSKSISVEMQKTLKNTIDGVSYRELTKFIKDSGYYNN